MKKLLSVMLIFTFLLSMTTICMAAPGEKEISVSLYASKPKVNVNETVTLTAITFKQGSGLNDYWSDNVSNVSTILNADGYYVSTATFSSADAGKYDITYNITMNASTSGTTFVGKGTITIEVVKPAIVIGAVVKDITITPKYHPNKPGVVNNYNVKGNVYAVWDNGEETFTEETSNVTFGGGQDIGSAKTESVSFVIEGVTYTYPVTFTLTDKPID